MMMMIKARRAYLRCFLSYTEVEETQIAQPSLDSNQNLVDTTGYGNKYTYSIILKQFYYYNYNTIGGDGMGVSCIVGHRAPYTIIISVNIAKSTLFCNKSDYSYTYKY